MRYLIAVTAFFSGIVFCNAQLKSFNYQEKLIEGGKWGKWVVDVPEGKVFELLEIYNYVSLGYDTGDGDLRNGVKTPFPTSYALTILNEATGPLVNKTYSEDDYGQPNDIATFGQVLVSVIYAGQLRFTPPEELVNFDSGNRLAVGPCKVILAYSGMITMNYRVIDNPSSPLTSTATPKVESYNLSDDFLMLDYKVQSNTTYRLGISKDLENWEPLFEFTPQSQKLNIELPKIILGNESYLKLE